MTAKTKKIILWVFVGLVAVAGILALVLDLSKDDVEPTNEEAIECVTDSVATDSISVEACDSIVK